MWWCIVSSACLIKTQSGQGAAGRCQRVRVGICVAVSVRACACVCVCVCCGLRCCGVLLWQHHKAEQLRRAFSNCTRNCYLFGLKYTSILGTKYILLLCMVAYSWRYLPGTSTYDTEYARYLPGKTKGGVSQLRVQGRLGNKNKNDWKTNECHVRTR